MPAAASLAASIAVGLMRHTFKRLLAGFSVLFGAYSLVKLLHHDLATGLWAFAVSLALVLGLLPDWLTSPPPKPPKAKAEKYTIGGPGL